MQDSETLWRKMKKNFQRYEKKQGTISVNIYPFI